MDSGQPRRVEQSRGSDPPVRPASAEFTPREIAVLAHLADGLSDKEIAGQLGIAASTVSKHVATILRKLGVDSRTAAAVRAVKAGIVP